MGGINLIELVDNLLHFGYNTLLLLADGLNLHYDAIRILIVFSDAHNHFLDPLVDFGQFLE